jgi:hypothetical protein
MKYLLSVLLIVSAYAHAAAPVADKSESYATSGACLYEAVFCGSYNQNNVSGYSVYRARDQKDLGNAVWNSNASECELAAKWANSLQNGLVCAHYYNAQNATTAYSLYRISDNQDLGKATIGDFNTCIAASRSLRNGIFCSTYLLNGQIKWSMYDVNTGNDIGTDVYGSLERCEQNY